MMMKLRKYRENKILQLNRINKMVMGTQKYHKKMLKEKVLN